MKVYSTEKEQDYKKLIGEHVVDIVDKRGGNYVANGFAKYGSRQELTRFLFRYDLFKQVQDIKGSIVECGVFAGNGVMSWAQLSAILEPMAFFRKVYGFDTFEGFPDVSESDLKGKENPDWKKGDLNDNSYEDLLRCIELFDLNRNKPQFSKVELVKGDFTKTAQPFLEENPHLLISILYMDFDIYEPTKKALEVFLPRMCKGSIVAFDEINNPHWPGETMALLQSLNIRDYSIRKFAYEPNMAYIVL